MDDKFIAHNIVKFYDLSEHMCLFSGNKKIFGGQIIDLKISDICQKAESIAIQVQGSGMAAEEVDLKGQKFDAINWLHNESNGYMKKDKIPYYRKIGKFYVTAPLHNIESSILGMENNHSIRMQSKISGEKIFYVSDIIKMFNAIRAETNRYVASIAKNISFATEDFNPPTYEVPEELKELMKKTE